jgi:PAS domain S-box-containing protein
MDRKYKDSPGLENEQDNQGIPLFDEILSRFDLSTVRLQDSYNQLREQVSSLTVELEKKHEELERNLKEKEKTENHLSSILESLPSGVVVVDRTGKITTFNREAELITGITRNNVEGEQFDRILKPSLSRDFPAGFQSMNTMSAAGECIFTQKGGREIQVHFTIIPLREKERDTGTEIESNIMIFHDVTQLKRLEEQAERTSRLTAMGEIAVSIAHEVRNPLGSIELLTSVLKQEVKDDQDKKKLTEHVLSGVKSIDCIINNLLLFTKPQPPVLQQVNMHSFLNDAVLFVAPSLKLAGVELIKHFNTHDPLIMGDPELLKQVFFNVAWNAIQAMPGGGELIISTETGKHDAYLSSASQHMEITVADSGTGIAEGDREQIFDPFFTTREKGTGLGLAIVNNIIEAHGGMINVKSMVGKGSAFTISLPLFRQVDSRD